MILVLHFCSFVFFLAFSVRVAGCCRFLSPWGVATLTGAKSSFTHGLRPGYTLNESPAHCRTLTLLMAVAATHQEQFWGSVSRSRILRHVAQSRPRGAGDSLSFFIGGSVLSTLRFDFYQINKNVVDKVNWINSLLYEVLTGTLETARGCTYEVTVCILSQYIGNLHVFWCPHVEQTVTAWLMTWKLYMSLLPLQDSDKCSVGMAGGRRRGVSKSVEQLKSTDVSNRRWTFTL